MSKAQKRTFSLTEENAAYIDGKVASGAYLSASEVVREGLRLVEEREAKLNSLREMLAASIAEGAAVTMPNLMPFWTPIWSNCRRPGIKCANCGILPPPSRIFGRLLATSLKKAEALRKHVFLLAF